MSEKEHEPITARLRVIVDGRVQGVSFRYYTQRRAQELGLTGHVRNLWDGTVEAVAEGPRPALEELLAFLRVGPRASVVTKVDVQWTAATHSFDRFRIRY
jgi:acylphosphatase